MDLIWRSEKIIKFGADFIWHSEKKKLIWRGFNLANFAILRLLHQILSAPNLSE